MSKFKMKKSRFNILVEGKNGEPTKISVSGSISNNFGLRKDVYGHTVTHLHSGYYITKNVSYKLARRIIQILEYVGNKHNTNWAYDKPFDVSGNFPLDDPHNFFRTLNRGCTDILESFARQQGLDI